MIGSRCGGPATTLNPEEHAAVEAVLLAARRFGFLGPGPVTGHIDQAVAFAGLVSRAPSNGMTSRRYCPSDPNWTGRILDLGSGGGVPGLVVSLLLPQASVTLLDANQRRTSFLIDSVDRLGVSSRVGILRGRAEEAGRDQSLRGNFDWVLARSFAPPAVTAECAAPFLRQGGKLLVSEPPAASKGAGSRWSSGGLSVLGMSLATVVEGGFHFACIAQVRACPAVYPRRSGIPAKRPLF